MTKNDDAVLDGKSVLVTGATGSFGKRFIRNVLKKHTPGRLIVFSRDELKQYDMAAEFPTADYPYIRYFLGDVRDVERLTMAFRGIDTVVHAAALKQVPAAEYNPFECIRTNVIGAENIVNAALQAGVSRVLALSTDKAVNPTNVMGATKRIAESYCQTLGLSLAAGDQVHTRLVTVRFGNVLASSGSVVPLFQRQIAAGGPVTVTDPEVTRYFMTTREAVQLVLQASALGARGKGGEIFVLDMGDLVLIIDLARQIIRLAGLVPDLDIKIKITGLRPGEKLFEENQDMRRKKGTVL